MSLWDGVFGRRRAKLSEPNGWGLEGGSYAGRAVTPESALGLSTAWACARLKSRVVGAMPCGIFERLADGEKKAATDHPLYELIHDSPNADQTAAEYWSGQVACLDMHGNGYSRKVRDGRDRIVALDPLRPDVTTVRRNEAGRRKYKTRLLDGAEEELDEDEVFHLRGFTIGGDVGLSAISYGRETMGMALAADETAARTFAQGLAISGFLQVDTKLDDKQRNSLITILDRFVGSRRAGKIMPIEKGMTFAPLNMKPEDAQLLQTRAFNVEEVCRWFDVPPILVGHAAEGQTMWGTGIEQIVLGWLTLGLDPLLTNIQQAIRKQLLSAGDRRRYYAEYNREGLLRADSAGRAEMYSKLFNIAALSPNQIADRENLPRFEGGDRRFVNSTLIPIDQVDAKLAPSAPAPAKGTWLPKWDTPRTVQKWIEQ